MRIKMYILGVGKHRRDEENCARDGPSGHGGQR